MTLPTDPERLAAYHICYGAASTLSAIYDSLSEIVVFELDKVWPADTPEYQAAAQTIEAIKVLLANKNKVIIQRAEEYLE